MSYEAATIGPTNPRIEFVAFARIFLRHRRNHVHPNTLSTDRSCVESHLTEAFAGQRVRDITAVQVASWHQRANKPRHLAVLSQLMQHAITLGVRPMGSNPCVGLRKKSSEFQACYPTEEDYAKLGELLVDEWKRVPNYARAAMCMLLTGMRQGEVRDLKWSDVQGDRLVLRDAKHGPRVVWITPPLRRLIEGYPRASGVRYVFCNQNGKKISYSVIGKWWSDVRQRHELGPMRLHDFRHGYASVATNLNYSRRDVGKLLGHRDAQSTMGYSHLSTPAKRAATEQVSQHIQAYLIPPRGENLVARGASHA